MKYRFFSFYMFKQHTEESQVQSQFSSKTAELKSTYSRFAHCYTLMFILQFRSQSLLYNQLHFLMRKHSIPAFIQQTWKMLENEQNWGIICWNFDDTSFLILDQKKIAEDLLPRYFKHSNFSSFIRQLNMYNFRKRKTSEGHIEFNHKLFRKNQKQLLIGIKRKPSEAEMLQADELIKQLAPQCFNQTKCTIDELQPVQEEENKISQVEQQKMQIEEENNRSLFAMLSWYLNGYAFTPCWGIQKNIKKNIILVQPPSMDLQTRTL